MYTVEVHAEKHGQHSITLLLLTSTKINSFLTKFHPDEFIWVIVPQLIITVTITHHGEDYVVEDGLEVWLNELPGCCVDHTRRKEKGKEEGTLMSKFAIKVCLRGWVRVGLGRVRVGYLG